MTKPEGQSQADARTFSIGQQELSLEGTSGIADQPARQAEGKPVRHDLMIGGQNMVAAGTSGPSALPIQIASGQGVRHEVVGEPPVTSATVAATAPLAGAGYVVGQPTRIS